MPHSKPITFKPRVSHFSSSNVWRQADLPKMSMNTRTDRFYRPKAGGYFSETSYYGSSFKSNKHHVQAEEPGFIDGRPLWQTEINKEVPAGASYKIESAFGATSLLLKSRAFVFQAKNPELNKTCKEQSQIDKVRNQCALVPSEGIASYDISDALTKRRSPVYSQSISK